MRDVKNIDNENLFHNKIVIINFFMTIAVVFLHAYNLDVYSIKINGSVIESFIFCFEKILNALQCGCVPFFFIISSFLFYRNYNVSKMKSKYKSRFYSLFVPYIIWNLIGFIFYFILTHLPSLSNNSGLEIVNLNFKTIIKFIFFSTGDDPLWYLNFLIIYVLLSPLIYFLFNDSKRKIKVGLLILIIIMIMHTLYDLNIIKLNISFLKDYYFIRADYFFGCYLGINAKKLPLLIKEKYIKLSRFLIIPLIIIICILKFFDITFTLEYIILAILLWEIMSINFIKNLDSTKYTVLSISFFIYAAHRNILESIEKVFYIVFGNKPIMALIDYIFAPIITISIIIVLSKIIKKYAPKMWNILNGGRV